MIKEGGKDERRRMVTGCGLMAWHWAFNVDEEGKGGWWWCGSVRALWVHHREPQGGRRVVACDDAEVVAVAPSTMTLRWWR